ncbi:hypothetical protein FANTH_7760 [Fusarium anthophilum]|uniref:Uncharacterized protein n=1 Tax=Fusarium anthophilum TaxID=48485 RepID=A0A8H4ZD54_9HYPO|nr:hypothetical protein FANTH_7760 [Fusarium anthophilum]
MAGELRDLTFPYMEMHNLCLSLLHNISDRCASTLDTLDLRIDSLEYLWPCQPGGLRVQQDQVVEAAWTPGMAGSGADSGPVRAETSHQKNKDEVDKYISKWLKEPLSGVYTAELRPDSCYSEDGSPFSYSRRPRASAENQGVSRRRPGHFVQTWWIGGLKAGEAGARMSFDHAMLFAMLQDHLANKPAEGKRLDEITYRTLSNLSTNGGLMTGIVCLLIRHQTIAVLHYGGRENIEIKLTTHLDSTMLS